MANTKRTIGVNLDASDLEALRQIAAQDRRSISFLIRDIVHEFLQRQGSTSTPASDPSILLQEIPSAIGLDAGMERGDVRLARELLAAAAHLDRLDEQSTELQEPKRAGNQNVIDEKLPDV